MALLPHCGRSPPGCSGPGLASVSGRGPGGPPLAAVQCQEPPTGPSRSGPGEPAATVRVTVTVTRTRRPWHPVTGPGAGLGA